MSKTGFPIDMNQDVTVQNHYFSQGSGVTTDGADLCFKQSHYEDKDGGNSPGWPEVVTDNSYLRSKFTWSQNPLTVDGTIAGGSFNGDRFYGGWGNTFGLGYHPWSDPRWIQSVARTDLINYLIGSMIGSIQKNDVNLGEILHTTAQTSRMFVNTLNTLVLAARRLKRGDFSGAAKAFGLGQRGHSGGGKPPPRGQGIPEQWLALRYGWLPLISDCYNSCEVVRKAWNDNGDLFKAKAKGARQSKFDVLTAHPQFHGPTLSWTPSDFYVSGKACITYGVESNFISSLSSLGILNPVSLAWELLPFSFVVDWALPIGNFLSSLDYHAGLFFKSGWISLKAKGTLTLSSSPATVVVPYSGGMIHADWSGGNGSGQAFVFERIILSDFPPVPCPELKNPFSPIHIANGLSLLATAFRS